MKKHLMIAVFVCVAIFVILGSLSLFEIVPIFSDSTPIFGQLFFTSLIGAIVGSIVYYLVYQLVICLEWDTDLLKLLSAVLVAVFLAIPHFKQKFAKPHIVLDGGENNA